MSPFWCLNFGVAHKFLTNFIYPYIKSSLGLKSDISNLLRFGNLLWVNSFQYFEELCPHHQAQIELCCNFLTFNVAYKGLS